MGERVRVRGNYGPLYKVFLMRMADGEEEEN
jgi:hypothetical protein